MKVDSRKFLSVGLLVLISTLAVNGATARENATVKDVSFSTIGDSLEVKFTTTQEVKFTYFELNDPHRLVVDFHGIQNDLGFRERQIANFGVRRVRAAFFESKNRKATRIVFDRSARGRGCRPVCNEYRSEPLPTLAASEASRRLRS